LIIRLADKFKIELQNAPDAITGYLVNEIGEHIVADDTGEQCDMLIEFNDSINFKGEVNYIKSSFTGGFNDNHFYLLDIERNKLEVKSFSDKEVINVEKGFSPAGFFKILEYFYMQKILDNNMMFLHSSGMTVNGKTILFPAYAGTGKTLILIQMMKKYNANFIGDDWTVMDGKGNSYPYYRKIRFGDAHLLEHKDVVKHYEFVKTPGSITSQNKLFSFPKRIYKYILYCLYPLGRFPPIRLTKKHLVTLPIKIGATEINKDNIVDYGNRAKIDYVIFISRSSSKKMNCKLIDATTLAEKVIWVLLSEDSLKPDFENWAIFANHYAPELMNMRIQKMKSIMCSCFGETNNMWLEIPTTASSEEIADYVIGEILKC